MEPKKELLHDQQSFSQLEDSHSPTEVGSPCINNKNRGGWITFPFIIGAVMGLSLAAGGWYANITVYAIQVYNIHPISAAQIHNVAGGGINTVPIIAAILADSFFGSYRVVVVAAFFSLLGGIMFTLSAALPHLKPPSCSPSSEACQGPSSSQYAFLYVTLALAIMGLGGTRFMLGTVGAYQFDKKEHRNVYFNWFVFCFEFGYAIAFTVIVYLQVNVSWALGYGINTASSAFAIVLFLLGSRFYRHSMPQGSPFTNIARVFVASLRKARLSLESSDKYFCESKGFKSQNEAPISSLRFFNRAALIKGGNAESSSQLEKSWRLCTMEEVEDVKKLLKAITIWGSGLLESTITATSSSLVTVQALVMDRHLGPHFEIPAGSVLVFTLLWSSILITILDRLLYPLWKKHIGWSLTPLQRIGIGYFFNTLCMVAYAIIEHKRLGLIRTYNLTDRAHAVAPMSVLWLVIPLGLLGSGVAFYYPAEMGFYYQEFPKALKTTATAMTSLRFAVGFYLSTAIIGVVQDTTSWLPDDISHGRVDKVYWLVSIIGFVNYAIYIAIAKLYKYSTNYESKDQTLTLEE